MHWNIEHRENDASVIVRVHVYLWSWECHILKSLFHLGIHLWHKLVEVRHLFRVVHCWWRPRFMQILNTINPPRDILWFLVSIFYRLYSHWRGTHYILTLYILQLKDRLVFAIEGWLVQLRNTQILLLSIWLWHLEASIDFTNSWYVVWHKWLQFCL